MVEVEVGPHVFDVPETRRLEAGSSDTWTVLVGNPVGVGNHDMVFWDETTAPPTEVEPPPVSLTQPITVNVVIGYGTTDFDPGDGPSCRTFVSRRCMLGHAETDGGRYRAHTAQA